MEEMLKLASQFYEDEYKDSVLYASLSRGEKDPKLKEEFLRLSHMESNHAKFWHDFLAKRGKKPEKIKIGRLSFFSVKLLRKLLGPGTVVSLLEMGENSAIQKYFSFLTKYKLSDEEREAISKIILDELEHERFFYESKKRFHVENIRDFVLGMNDGLVELLGAVTGLSAVYIHNPKIVGISGLIVGVAGALSMGIGAFISVRSQRQVNESVKQRMEVLFKVSPKRAKEELIERLLESGMPEEVAKEVAEKLSSNENAMINLLVQESNENELRSALYTGLAYLTGVAFPVLPYFVASSSLLALPFSILLAGTALAMVASVISILSGISIRKKVFEMVSTGLGAAFLSYLFGRLMESLFHISAL
ncbi:VIT1/CCC1 transporter family protein [Thermococcus alcaliphilus]|uniref:VIT1/CCC1 transporter family protein n=1 Tax=Thermococcus alcaliphilus TaxID=139207 RepID=UPI0020913C69|nr:VIT1/CCC1 transporter family protein [Thermococcus alcaliphilus]MCO6040439.1 VIT1/CCC1 transporter family protein [Thermococcus alcaliphilus]